MHSLSIPFSRSLADVLAAFEASSPLVARAAAQEGKRAKKAANRT
jgi:hypothetical protein